MTVDHRDYQGSRSTTWTAEDRRWFRRRYRFEANGTAGTVPVLPQGGFRTAGSTYVSSSPLLRVNTGTPAGPNRIAQVHEVFTAELNADPTSYLSEEFSWWKQPQYASVIMGAFAIDIINPTPTMYAGLELAAYSIFPPYPVPPAGGGTDQACLLRARLDTGAWELVQDNSSFSRVDVLAGVRAFIPERAFRLEILYEPGALIAKINGTVGAALSGADVILDAETFQPHAGSGIFVSSGTHAAARAGLIFQDLRAEVLLPTG